MCRNCQEIEAFHVFERGQEPTGEPFTVIRVCPKTGRTSGNVDGAVRAGDFVRNGRFMVVMGEALPGAKCAKKVLKPLLGLDTDVVRIPDEVRKQFGAHATV